MDLHQREYAQDLGYFEGSVSSAGGETQSARKVTVKGCLEPARTVEFTQIVDGEAVGGVTVSVRMPRLPRQITPARRR